MQVGVKDKVIKAAIAAPTGSAVKGLQLVEADRIRLRYTVLVAASTLKVVADAHPEWRVHEWKGRKGFWSIDVLGNTRLLFNYDGKAHTIANMTYEDPH